MKKIFLALAILASLPLGARKKDAPKPETFPDGTPVSEWFKDCTVKAPEELGTLYNLRDFGAVSSAALVQTQLIQSVIDSAAAAGGGVIVVPEGIYKTGSLFFRQGTHLYLSRGAILLGSESILDFPVIETRIEGEICKYFGGVVNADGLDGFTITGPGTIDGNGSTYWQAFRLRRQWNPKCTNKDEQRPRLVHISNCTNVTLAGATFQNSPFWTCHIYKCENVRLFDLRIFSPRSPIASASADGIDMDVCRNMHIKGCRITVNDDAVCFKGGKGPWADTDPANGPNSNILVEDCFFDRTTGSCVTCGSECVFTTNVLIRNCKVDRGMALLQLKMRPDTPQHYQYITIENIEGSCRDVLRVAPWSQFFDLKGREDIPMSYGEHIVFRNLNLECSKDFVDISKANSHNVEEHLEATRQQESEQYLLNDITFENVHVTAPDPGWNREYIGGLTLKDTFVNGVEQ